LIDERNEMKEMNCRTVYKCLYAEKEDSVARGGIFFHFFQLISLGAEWGAMIAFALGGYGAYDGTLVLV